MIAMHTITTLSVAGALLAGLAAATAPESSREPSATGFARPAHGGPAPTATNTLVRDVPAGVSVRAAAGTCGEHEINVFDPFAGRYRLRTAQVCRRVLERFPDAIRRSSGETSRHA